jgi:hypothetical protein
MKVRFDRISYILSLSTLGERTANVDEDECTINVLELLVGNSY